MRLIKAETGSIVPLGRAIFLVIPGTSCLATVLVSSGQKPSRLALSLRMWDINLRIHPGNRKFNMAQESNQNELRNEGKGRIGSINHLRLTVTDIQRAERFYRPLMRFMDYELCDREEDRLAWAKWSSSGVFWLILTVARQDTKPARHDLLSPGFHHLAWNADSRDQVDNFYRLLLENGATVLAAPAEYDYEPGYYAVFFTDPDGMKLEFMHVPERPRTIQ